MPRIRDMGQELAFLADQVKEQIRRPTDLVLVTGVLMWVSMENLQPFGVWICDGEMSFFDNVLGRRGRGDVVLTWSCQRWGA